MNDRDRRILRLAVPSILTALSTPLIGIADTAMIGHCLGADTPPMLRHYLEKRSYAKALDFLEGRDGAAAPNC